MKLFSLILFCLFFLNCNKPKEGDKFLQKFQDVNTLTSCLTKERILKSEHIEKKYLITTLLISLEQIEYPFFMYGNKYKINNNYFFITYFSGYPSIMSGGTYLCTYDIEERKVTSKLLISSGSVSFSVKNDTIEVRTENYNIDENSRYITYNKYFFKDSILVKKDFFKDTVETL